jgi:glycosyltransferase involved in cell wall biosynthesis
VRVRALEVLATLKRAGAERVAVSIATGLDRERFEAAVVSLYPPFTGGLESELERAGVRVWHLGKQRGFDPRMWPRLRRVIREFQPAVVHTHSYVLRYAWPASWFRKTSIVHTVHNVALREVDAVGRAIHRRVFAAGGRAVAISPEIARSFEAVYGSAPTATIANGVDLGGAYRPECRQAWREKHGFAPDDVLIASVARLEPQKNPLGLIDAFASACKENAHAQLLMAGDGTLLGACRARAAACEVSSRVHFLGVRSDIAEMLSACDVFALASAWEGAPMAVIEAMAAHLPVVAPAVGGVPDQVEHGVSGLLTPPGDTAALAAAFAALTGDGRRRAALGEAAAHRSARFNSRTMVQAYGALFEAAAREAGR